jgi:hypothetical protein
LLGLAGARGARANAIPPQSEKVENYRALQKYMASSRADLYGID